MPKKKLQEVKSEETNQSFSGLKEKARAFRKHLNTQYQESVAYVPDAETVERVSVSSWIEMPEAFQTAVGIPGLPIGNITHVYGKPDTGKTTLLMEGIAQAQKQDILPILILTEHKFDFSRLDEWMGADSEAMVVLHADNIEQAYSFMDKILKDLATGKLVIEDEEGNDIVIDMSDQKCFIFMDSIGNTLSETELDYEVEEWDKSMGKHAKALRSLTKRLNLRLSKKGVRDKCGILLLNQSYQSMPSYGPSVETPYGGDGVPYSCVLNIRLRRKRDIKMTQKGVDTVVGLETTVEVKKNHISHKKPVSTVYTVASGMIPVTKEALDRYKKSIR